MNIIIHYYNKQQKQIAINKMFKPHRVVLALNIKHKTKTTTDI